MKIDCLGRKPGIRANAVCNVINREIPNSRDGSDLLGNKPMQFGKGPRFAKALSDCLEATIGNLQNVQRNAPLMRVAFPAGKT